MWFSNLLVKGVRPGGHAERLLQALRARFFFGGLRVGAVVALGGRRRRPRVFHARVERALNVHVGEVTGAGGKLAFRKFLVAVEGVLRRAALGPNGHLFDPSQFHCVRPLGPVVVHGPPLKPEPGLFFGRQHPFDHHLFEVQLPVPAGAHHALNRLSRFVDDPRFAPRSEPRHSAPPQPLQDPPRIVQGQGVEEEVALQFAVDFGPTVEPQHFQQADVERAPVAREHETRMAHDVYAPKFEGPKAPEHLSC